MTDEIFSNDESQKTENNTQEPNNPLDVLVGEGKKFKTIEDLAKGKLESDQYIDLLTKKLEQAEAEVKTRISIEEFISQSTKSPQIEKVMNDTTKPKAEVKESAESIDSNTILSLVEEVLNRKEQEKIVKKNSDIVSETLINVYGSVANAKNEINNKAQENSISVQELQRLSINSPKAFFNLMGITNENITKTQKTNFLPSSSVGVTDVDTGVRGKSYYEKMKIDNPKLYYDQKTTVQMMKDAKKLGLEKFNSI